MPEESDGRDNESASPRPFLELDTTDDSESEHRASGDTRNRETDSEIGPGSVEEASSRIDSSVVAANQLSKTRPAKATADQFPLPPSAYPPESPTRVEGINSVVGSNTRNSGSMMSSGSLLTSSYNTLAPDAGSRRTRDKVDSFIMPGQPEAKFRQMPLLDTDLKTATVEVVGSHIRANDKGKEVLSFVIVINVVGKESWQVSGVCIECVSLSCV